MTDAGDAWKEVGKRVEGLGRKLKLHLEQETDTSVPDRGEGDTENAFEELSGKVTEAFDAFGNAARDEAVHADVRDIAELIKEALIETFQAVGAEVGELVDQMEDFADDAAEKLVNRVGIDIEIGDGDSDKNADDDDERDPVIIEVTESTTDDEV